MTSLMPLAASGGSTVRLWTEPVAASTPESSPPTLQCFSLVFSMSRPWLWMKQPRLIDIENQCPNAGVPETPAAGLCFARTKPQPETRTIYIPAAMLSSAGCSSAYCHLVFSWPLLLPASNDNPMQLTVCASTDPPAACRNKAHGLLSVMTGMPLIAFARAGASLLIGVQPIPTYELISATRTFAMGGKPISETCGNTRLECYLPAAAG